MIGMGMQTETEKLIKTAKRNCMFCYGRARLRDTEAERKQAQNSVKQMQELYEENYNDLRKQDAPADWIQKNLENKRVCMDALDACDKCDKTVDLLNRQLIKIR